ncbi:hypothetical protein GCM10011374_29650 [Kocuria dechangensis]|uniref:Uncharacterized protein n=1 Tax=Kocuria dechangensis TaxID=1176249 RepID=A0A917H1F8_9MICC|nr:hypothetical protein GCM10011374_29650 [Kocuria dechangensis]
MAVPTRATPTPLELVRLKVRKRFRCRPTTVPLSPSGLVVAFVPSTTAASAGSAVAVAVTAAAAGPSSAVAESSVRRETPPLSVAAGVLRSCCMRLPRFASLP